MYIDTDLADSWRFLVSLGWRTMVHIGQVYYIVTMKIKRLVALVYTVMKNERLNSVQTGSGHL